MQDGFGRTIDYLRISITDRCNLRCKYCMPEEGVPWRDMKEILTYEEIETFCRIGAELGISKIKVTGGEPLVRKGCPGLIRKLKEIPGIREVTMTTNGVLLEEYLDDLCHAGLDAVNISLDTLCPEVYESLTGRPYLFKVQKGLEAALSQGLKVKVNVVLQEGINDGEWKNLTELAKDAPLDVRFIELMPIGYGKRGKGIAGDEILKKLTQDFGPLKEDVEIHGNGPARYVRIPGYKGSIGFISAMHGKFCDSCNRLRLTSTGEIKPCLCYGESFPIRELLRTGDLEGVREILKEAILKKPAEHCFTELEKITETKRMTEIGG